MLDPYKVREDFPSIVGDYIFMNNADSTGIPVPVLERVLVYYNEVKSRPGFESTPSYRALELYQEALETILKHLGVVGENIVFSSSNFQSLMLVLQSIEFRSNDVFLISSNTQGKTVNLIKEYVSANRGRMEMVDLESENVEEKLKAIVRKGVKAAFINHVCGATGVVAPLDKVVPILKDKGIIVILDATYSMQRMKLNLPKMGIDYAYFKSGNMFSIEGVSVLYFSEERTSSIKRTQGYSILKRGEEEKHVDIVALAAAIRYLEGLGFEDVLNHERSLVDEITNIAAGDGISFYQAASKDSRTGIFSLMISQLPSNLLQIILEDQFHIIAESGGFDSPLLLQKTGGKEALRLSPTIFNTVEEARKVGEKLAEIRESWKEKAVEKQPGEESLNQA
ncbi:MAG: aminotransferase class V-fold PLP-dependent enzyme [Candidatus Brockarchaeota archaeon]|nr:aminotransferase class V-fold PLP-dependent enzyme [Candidatus Brockarchaeota archaeon]